MLLTVATPYRSAHGGDQDRVNDRSLLQKIVSFIGLFCKRDLSMIGDQTSILLSADPNIWISSNVWISKDPFAIHGEVGGWGRDPKKCTGRDWGMGSSTI